MLYYTVIGLVMLMISGGMYGCATLEVIDDAMDCTYLHGRLDCTVDKDKFND